MQCKDLVKKNYNVLMVDDNGFELDLENDFNIQKYEKSNDVVVKDMVNEFFSIQDKGFNEIISEIEQLIEKYHIDYYIYGDGKGVAKDRLAIMYNLKNRSSCVDCNLKVFYYNENYKSEDKLSYMIDFSEGSSGDNLGYSFYRYFNSSSFYKVKPAIEKYFSSDEEGSNDREVISECMKNVKKGLDYYYSE